MEKDFIQKPFLKLYATLKGNTNGIKKTHADESSARDFEKGDFSVRVHVPSKIKNNKVKIMLEEDFVKQPFLKLYSKSREILMKFQKPHADESSARDFEKEIVPCVSMCLKKEIILKNTSHWTRISSSNRF